MSLSKRIIHILIVYLGHLEFFSQQILINNYLLLIRLINEQIMQLLRFKKYIYIIDSPNSRGGQ